MSATLQDFLRRLESAGELHRVREEVSPLLEVSEAADRHSKAPAASASEHARHFDPDHCDRGGKALLFENIAGCDFPLAINVFGSYRRMEMALGCDASRGGFEAIARRIAALLKPEPPQSIGDLLAKARQFFPLLRIPPKRVRRGICQEVVRLSSRGEVDLMRLPLIKCWPLDGDPQAVGYDINAEEAGTAGGQGRYITFAGMHTIHADDEYAARPASHNIGMYRAQLLEKTSLAMHWHVHHDGAAHWRSWKRLGRPMPMAICLGGEPVLPYAATAPLPPGMSELLMAGFLNGRGIPMVRAKTVPLWVPANSEIVIEGWVSTACGAIGYSPCLEGGGPGVGEADDDRTDPTHRLPPSLPGTGNARNLGPGAVFEGPFGDHTGFYSLPDRYPIMEVSAITHRKDAVYPTTIVGLPPQEDYYLGKATERIFLPLLKTIIHDIEDYHLPMFGCFHNCAFIRIDKQYPLQARRVMHAVWGAGQMAWTKMIVIVDSDVNVHDEQAVLAALLEHCAFARDIELVNGPLDILDHAAPRLGAGHKVGFDATRTVPGEEVTLTAAPDIDAPAEPSPRGPDAHPRALAPDHIHKPPFAGNRCAFIGVDKRAPGDGARAIAALMDDPAHSEARFIIAVDRSVNLHHWQEVFFHLCANTDPGRDMIRRGNRLAFDATQKMPGDERAGQPVRRYPPIIAMTDEIRQRVVERSAVFGL